MRVESEGRIPPFDLGLTAIALDGDDIAKLRRSVALFQTALLGDHWMLGDERLALEWREQLVRAQATVLGRIEQIRNAQPGCGPGV